MERTDLTAHTAGQLGLEAAGLSTFLVHLFRQDPDSLFERYMDAPITRLPAPRT